MSHVGGRKDLRSPEEQTAEIDTWAKARGHQVHFLEPELDRKGSDASRPIFREAVEGVKARTYDGVVVAYLSRAGRDLRLMLDLWDEVEAAGGIVYFARENIDASSPSGKLQRNIFASIAQHELEERRDGFERATKAAVERGIWQRRQTPRGYDRDPQTRRLVLNDQAKEVKQAAGDYLAGTPIVALADRVGMTPGGIRFMLRNRVYLGELKVRSYVNPEAHDPILDPETFAALQAKLDGGPRPVRGAMPAALLGGLVRCASCGHVMTRSRGGQQVYYRCIPYHSGTKCPAPATITCARLDPVVEELALRELEKLRITAAASDNLGPLRAELAEAQRELSGYLEAVDIAGIGSADAAAGMRTRRERVDEAKTRLEVEMARAPTLPAIEVGADVWEGLSHEDRNSLLRSLLAAVVVWPLGKRGAPVPAAERIRVLRYGTPLGPPWPDVDSEDVLGVLPAED